MEVALAAQWCTTAVREREAEMTMGVSRRESTPDMRAFQVNSVNWCAGGDPAVIGGAEESGAA